MFNDISCGSKKMKKNAWRMPNSFLCMQRDLEKDNGHSLVLVLKRSGTVSLKTVHKEFGTIWLKGCCWNLQKAVVQSSALRAHCPEVDSNHRTWTTVDTLCSRFGNDWSNFSHNCFCKPAQSLRSNCWDMRRVWNLSWKNVETRLCWSNQVSHTCEVWLRQNYLWIVMTQPTKIFICSNMEDELKSCHNKTNWAKFVWAQDFWMLLKSDSTSWQTTLQSSHKSQMQWPVVSTLCQEERASEPKG